MGVNVGRAALLANRDRLAKWGEQIADEQRDVACLLLFYAAECGLKAELIRRSGSRDSVSLARSHDLRSLARALNLPGSVMSGLIDCRARHDVNQRVPIRDLHEAWRYGARLDPSDEKKARVALRALIRWCQQA
ncbi:hypothetical protein [Nocardiopsis tropica]|uniref:HEPN domain-containing protein n=1 Tax=Nocardiopsis tropica TaxID=109330 RepID=A0ABV1ZWT5_9ACTN